MGFDKSPLLLQSEYCIEAFFSSRKQSFKKGKKSQQAEEESADEKADADEPLFTVPDGTAADLFDFISEMERARPKERTRDALIEHVKLQINAVVEACIKIRKSDPGEELEVCAIQE